MLAADVRWPGWGRAAWMRASNGRVDPRSASIDSAAAISAARASRSAPRAASAATAVDGCVPLMSASPSFGASVTGVKPRGASASRPGSTCVLSPTVASPSPISTSDEMRQRREIAAGADRAAAGDARVHAPIEQLDEQVERAATDSGEALREHVGAQRHRRAHGRTGGSGSPTPAAWLRKQIQLQRAKRFAWNRRFRQRAKSGVDAVDGFIAGCLAIDDGARGVDACGRRRLRGRPARSRRRWPAARRARANRRRGRIMDFSRILQV